MNQPPDQSSSDATAATIRLGICCGRVNAIFGPAATAVGEFRILLHPEPPPGRLAIYLSESDPFTVNRRSRDIEDDSAFDYLVLVQLEGSAEMNRKVAVPGD
jgi:hypothetical protein